VTGDIEVGGRKRQVRVQRLSEGLRVQVDGVEWIVDVARIDGQTMSLLVGGTAAPGALDRDGSGAEFEKRAPGHRPTQSLEVTLTPEVEAGRFSVRVRGVAVPVVFDDARRARRGAGAASAPGIQRLVAPMPGRIVRVPVSKGARVAARQTVVVVEAMKMENELRAAQEGIVSELSVREGQLVDAGALLAVIEP
jgi:biotin carboxyl carrier protein